MKCYHSLRSCGLCKQDKDIVIMMNKWICGAIDILDALVALWSTWAMCKQVS